MEPVAPWVPQVGGETAEQLFRSVPCRLTVTVSPIGAAAVRVPIQGRTIRLQSQWADPSPRRRLSLITDANTRRSNERSKRFANSVRPCARPPVLPDGQLEPYNS